MTSDPFGITVSSTIGNMGVNVACIQFKTIQHLDLVSLVLKVNSELANLLTEAIAVLNEL